MLLMPPQHTVSQTRCAERVYLKLQEESFVQTRYYFRRRIGRLFQTVGRSSSIRRIVLIDPSDMNALTVLQTLAHMKSDGGRCVRVKTDVSQCSSLF